mgnify:CR=1 FL=1
MNKFRMFPPLLGLVFLLAGCGDKKTDDGQTDGKTLVVGTQNFDGKFSPFFYTNDYENKVMGCLLYTSPSPRDTR